MKHIIQPIIDNIQHTTDKPLAAKGLTSYRYKGVYGFIMIGATDTNDALKEAQRSISFGFACIHNLQVWNSGEYINIQS